LSFTPEPALPSLRHDDPPQPQISARTQELLDAAKQAQDAIVERAIAEANLLRAQKEEVSQLFRELRQQKVYEIEEEKQRITREQEEDRRRRLALYGERQRIEYERVRLDKIRQVQEIERRREEILQRRRQLEEERRAQEEAAAEVRRREQEEAERIRQERLRQCAVCMDEADIDLMVQLPCTHWYCVDDLDGKSFLIGSLAYQCSNGCQVPSKMRSKCADPSNAVERMFQFRCSRLGSQIFGDNTS